MFGVSAQPKAGSNWPRPFSADTHVGAGRKENQKEATHFGGFPILTPSWFPRFPNTNGFCGVLCVFHGFHGLPAGLEGRGAAAAEALGRAQAAGRVSQYLCPGAKGKDGGFLKRPESESSTAKAKGYLRFGLV